MLEGNVDGLTPLQSFLAGTQIHPQSTHRPHVFHYSFRMSRLSRSVNRSNRSDWRFCAICLCNWPGLFDGEPTIEAVL